MTPNLVPRTSVLVQRCRVKSVRPPAGKVFHQGARWRWKELFTAIRTSSAPSNFRSTLVGRNTQETRKITKFQLGIFFYDTTKNTVFRGREIQYLHFQPAISEKRPKRSSIDGTKMVWMPLMNKTNMRRRQSKSPSSSDGAPRIKNGILFGAKHKRRILRKRDSTAITEASSLGSRAWSVDTDNALWRVGKSSAL